MRFAFVTALIPILLTTGCIMPRPWKYDQYIHCSDSSAGPDSTAQLFITLRLPRCGDRPLELTRYRGHEPRYASLDRSGRITLHRRGLWEAELRRRVDRDKLAPVISIHGYNNDNGEALTAAAQIAWALKWKRQVVALSWPSYGTKRGYFWDEANAEWSLRPASTQLGEFVQRFPGTTIVAHSMGNRLALQAVADLDASNQLSKISRLVMAAADVDRGALSAAWGTAGPHLPITMYVSLRDQPLSMSWRGHGYPRAGDLSRWVSGRNAYYHPFAWLPRVEVIDTTDVDRSTLGHTAFIGTRAGRADLCRAVAEVRPRERALVPLLLPADRSNYFRLTDSLLNDGCD